MIKISTKHKIAVISTNCPSNKVKKAKIIVKIIGDRHAKNLNHMIASAFIK